MKNAIIYQESTLFLIVLLLSCTMLFASCSGDTSSSSAAITPIGASATCLTLNTPSLVKLADGNYKLVEKIDNCGNKNAGPLQVTVQIGQQTLNLLGPTTISANKKATYNTSAGQTSGTDKEISFASPPPASTTLTILATINGNVQGEWDGEATIPA